MPKIDIKSYDILVAMVLLTRLPLPPLHSQTFNRQSISTWSFSLVGAIITVPLCLLAYGLLSFGLIAPVTAVLFVAGQMLLTGAMHEDGLADTADGFWGGFTPERRLEIMKDSQIGTYGVLTLIISVSLRGLCYTALFSAGGLWGGIAIAMLSRATMPALMRYLPHARSSGLSQSVGRPEGRYCSIAILLAMGFACAFLNISTVFALTFTATCTTLAIGAVARRKINGQTGDVLGACQQLSEIAMLSVLMLLI
ncbi:adenosylcobinamide-GDP ribazoletransferase [Epibacterium ulvae]|uniref:adenosylcobinamide-GDP ribazoletransferase n=1 Tax=Epibacterium ulvae TaxID=1156985 RepID=UPI0024901362|nr:adenosylcobinamide-GDP ribazoletransferase [Epibacterium ulvae]